jgi:hypothetical protein
MPILLTNFVITTKVLTRTNKLKIPSLIVREYFFREKKSYSKVFFERFQMKERGVRLIEPFCFNNMPFWLCFKDFSLRVWCFLFRFL